MTALAIVVLDVIIAVTWLAFFVFLASLVARSYRRWSR